MKDVRAMRSAPVGWKEIGLVAATVLLNALLLAQLVGGPRGQLATAFAVQYENGESCTGGSECISGFCVDRVCCNSACDAAGQSCTVPGSVGACISPAQSPVMSLPFQWVAAGLVALITILRLRRRLH
jgi:hypothetical protein